MFKPVIPTPEGRPLRVLAIGAHADDIEIGCGASMLRLAESTASLEVWWAVLTGDDRREDEARRSAKDFVGDALVEVIAGRLSESRLPYEPLPVKEFIHGLHDLVQPDLVFTHCRGDLHQDHRFISELVGQAFRNHLVLEFEIPKFDGDLGSPNVFLEVSESQIHRKIELLHEHFPSQRTKYWFDEQLFLGLARIRGVESRSESGFAEGFYCRKIIF